MSETFDLEKFKCLPKPRENQIEILPKIIDAFKKKKYVILEAPTGSGKCLAENEKIKIKVSKELYKILIINKK